MLLVFDEDALIGLHLMRVRASAFECEAATSMLLSFLHSPTEVTQVSDLIKATDD